MILEASESPCLRPARTRIEACAKCALCLTRDVVLAHQCLELLATAILAFLPRSVTTINAQIGARHERGCIADEENGSSPVLLRGTEPA